MTEKRYKIFRNIFILIGIVGGFVIWLFVPTVIRNDAFIHVGNGSYGLKWGCLVLLLIPLCALIPVNEPINDETFAFHSDDEEIKNRVRKKAAQLQMLTAIVTSVLVLIIMTVTLFR